MNPTHCCFCKRALIVYPPNDSYNIVHSINNKGESNHYFGYTPRAVLLEVYNKTSTYQLFYQIHSLKFSVGINHIEHKFNINSNNIEDYIDVIKNHSMLA